MRMTYEKKIFYILGFNSNKHIDIATMTYKFIEF